MRRKRKKSNPFKWWFIILPVFVLLPFYYGAIYSQIMATIQWFSKPVGDPNYPHYESYNIKIPLNFEIHGIDVSRYQGEIDWKRIAIMEDKGVQIKFSFIKATEGLFIADPKFHRNWKESKRAGIVRGAYHYFKPGKSGYWQARFFLQTVNFKSGDLLPVVDVEELGKQPRKEFVSNLKSFLTVVEDKLGVKPIIYSGYKFYEDNLATFNGYPLWIAHYYRPKMKVLSNNSQWSFWQHSDKAHVNGINHRVDMNVFNGSLEEFEKLRIK